MSFDEKHPDDVQKDDLAGLKRDPAAGEMSEMTVVAEGEERTTIFVWLLACNTTYSNSYDTGVISGALVTIGSDLGPHSLSSTQDELITSATTLGALIGGLTAGIMSDYCGRKPVLAIADVIFLGGAIGQAVCHTVSAMIGGRFLIGIADGLAACIAPLYIQELSPTRLRGRMVTLNVVAITGGQVIAYGIGAAFENTHESPRIMVRTGKQEAARHIMQKIYAYATPEQIDLKVRVLTVAVQEAIDITNTTTFKQRLYSIFFVPINRRALSQCAL
ncbi:hypothetical protein BU17DRAFT_73770 [Hysterangium stoloniferum]|nr:hypothetical protein BU17DRAFT_73770 [Hysterangium stoloniferum]